MKGNLAPEWHAEEEECTSHAEARVKKMELAHARLDGGRQCCEEVPEYLVCAGVHKRSALTSPARMITGSSYLPPQQRQTRQAVRVS